MFFSWYYFSMNVGSLLGEGGCPLMRQHVSFAATYATIMVSMVRSAVASLHQPARARWFLTRHVVVPDPWRVGVFVGASPLRSER